MDPGPTTKPVKHGIALKSFALEVVVYAVLVFAYYFLVLHLLGDWFKRLYHDHRTLYAFVAVAAIFVQGIVLEWITRLLLGWITPEAEEPG